MDQRRVGLWATLLFAAAAAVGVLFQVFFIGAFLFGEGDALDTHKDLGKLVHLCYVLTFVAALVAVWPEWRSAAWPFALAAVGTVQAFLAGGDASPWVHAFHAALVPIVFVIALRIAMRAKDALSSPRNPEHVGGETVAGGLAADARGEGPSPVRDRGAASSPRLSRHGGGYHEPDR